MAKLKVGDTVTIKTKEELEATLGYTKGIGFVGEGGVTFISPMEKLCGQTREIKRIEKINNINFYYFGPDPRMDFAFVKDFFKE